MDIAFIILLAGVLIFASHLFEWLFSFTKIPDVLLLMIIGLLLGPWLGVLTPDFFGEAAPLWVTIALVVILFEGATKLHLDTFMSAWRNTTLLSISSFIVSMGVVGGLVWMFTDLHPVLALALGAIVGDNAVALITPMLERLNLQPASRTVLFMESAVSDVLSIVLALGLLQAYELGVFEAERVMMNIMTSFFAAAFIGMICAFVWSVLLNKVRHMQNSIFATPAFVFVVFGMVEALDLSGLVAAIAFGITLGNIPFLQRWLQERHHVLQAMLHPLSLNRSE
jgi:potassium/hydrogen antiporter